MSLKHLVVLESKEMLQKDTMKKVYQRHKSQIKELPVAKSGKILATK